MKIYCSYAYTGEDQVQLQQRLEHVVEEIERLGHTPYCYHFSDHRTSDIAPNDALTEALAQLKSCDAIFVIVSSDRRSEGQLMEVGAALALGKRVFVGQHQTAVDKTYVPSLAEHTFVWDSLNDLIEGLRHLFDSSEGLSSK